MYSQSLRYSRLIHNALIFTISLFISFYSHIPFAFWVSATVLAIMLPMDSSQISERIKGTFWGTLQGIVLFIPLWLMIDLNGGLIYIFIPLSLVLANFFQIHNFSRNIAFLNINLGLFLEYMQYGNYHFSAYIVARIMTILIGISLAWLGDFFFTHRKNYALSEFVDAISRLNVAMTQEQNTFNNYNFDGCLRNQEERLILHVNLINQLTTALSTHYKSILVEQRKAHLGAITTHYNLLLPLLKQYKLELFGIGYALSSPLTVGRHQLQALVQRLLMTSNQMLNHTQYILQA